MNLKDRHFFLILFVCCVCIYALGLVRVKSILWGDTLYYYSTTRSLVMDGDINFSNEAYREVYGFPNPPEVSLVTGMVGNKFSVGSSLLWIPSFVLGQMMTFLASIFGLSVLTDGYGLITQCIVAVSTIAFSLFGLYLLYKTLTQLFSKTVAVLSTVTVFLTSQLFYYTAVDPLNSHSASFMLSSVLLFLTVKISESKITWQKMIVFGFVGGLLMLVRNQDAVVYIPPLAYLLLKEKKLTMDSLNWAVLALGTACIVMSIQIFVTIVLYGQLGSPYLIRGEKINWLSPDFIRVLFSYGNGLFVFAPITFIALGGLIREIIVQKRRYLVVTSLSIFLLQLYVVAAWGAEIVGGPYGSRMFVSTLPWLSIGIGYLLSKYYERKKFILAWGAGTAILTANMLVQTVIMLYRF